LSSHTNVNISGNVLEGLRYLSKFAYKTIYESQYGITNTGQYTAKIKRRIMSWSALISLGKI